MSLAQGHHNIAFQVQSWIFSSFLHLFQTCYAPIIVLPHYPPPPLGLKWGFGRGFDTKILPHHGAFDISGASPHYMGHLKTCKKSQVPRVKSPPKSPHRTWGLCGDLTRQVCPTMGHLTFWCVKSQLLPHISPRGGGVVGLYIDRCISSGGSRIFEKGFQLLAKAPAQFELKTNKKGHQPPYSSSAMCDAFSLHCF